MKGKYVFEEPNGEHFKAFHQSNPLWKMFEPFLLVHNHRQGEGGKWTEALNRFRVGTFTDNDLDFIRARITKKKFLDHDAEHVMYKNEDVRIHNEKMLKSIKSPEVILSAFKYPIKGYKYTIEKNLIDGTTFRDKLAVKIGARISLIHNILTLDELVNGSSGTIIDIVQNKKGNVDAIIIDFDQATAGQQYRNRYRYYLDVKKHANGTPIVRYELKYVKQNQIGFRITTVQPKISQFPMCLCWASTAHKMQVNIYLALCFKLFS